MNILKFIHLSCDWQLTQSATQGQNQGWPIYLSWDTYSPVWAKVDSCRLFPFLWNGEWTGTHIASFCLICALKMPHWPNHTHTFIQHFLSDMRAHTHTFWPSDGCIGVNSRFGIFSRWTGGNQSTDLLIKKSLSVTKFKYTFTEPTISYKSELKINNTSVFHIMKKTADCPSARLFRVTLCVKVSEWSLSVLPDWPNFGE